MTTDTEARLRAALRAGAELITVEPAELPPVPRSLHDRRLRPRLVWGLAAAAVVAAVAALAVAVQHHSSSAPPVNQPTVSRSVTPPVPDGLRPATCAATNGGSWHTTLVTAPDTPPGVLLGALWLLGIDSHGNTVALEQTKPNRILLIPASAPTQTRDLYTAPTSVPGQGPARLGSGTVDGDWVAFSIITGGGQGGLSGIEAVNTKTGDVQIIRNVSLGSELIVSEPIVVKGVVYWSELSNFGSGHVYAFDLTTHTRSTLTTGPDMDPFTVGGGVYWIGPRPKQVHTYRAGTLPPGYVVQATSAPGSVLLAGNLMAWNEGRQIFVRKGSAPPVRVATGSQVAIGDDYLVYESGAHATTVLDMHTGATLALPEPGPLGLPAAGGAGMLALNTLGSHGGSDLTLAHVATLPRLHC